MKRIPTDTGKPGGNPGTDKTFPRFPRKQYQKPVNVPSVPIFFNAQEDGLQMCWNYLVVHRHEIVWAMIFAAIFDWFSVSSRIRRVGRFIANKWAEKSVGRIRKRIKELEVYRDSLASYLVSDKAHYLSTLRNILALLVSMALGISILVVARIRPLPRYVIPGSVDLFALICFAMAIVIGVVGLQIAAPDYQSKISKMIQGVDANIAKLRAKLPAE